MVENGSFLWAFLIAVGLSADCFAVALGSSISLGNRSLRHMLRLASSFGLFQASMTALGWFAGQTVVEFIKDYDHWVAFALLAVVGGKMLRDSFRTSTGQQSRGDFTRNSWLLLLSIATSIDALAVGLSFTFMDMGVNIASASLTIGVVAFVVTSVGFMLGGGVGKLVGKRAEAIGGIILLAIGVRVLFSHIVLL